MTGQAQAAAAAEHITQAVNRLAAFMHSVEELMTHAAGIQSDATSAAEHLESVAGVVGSATAAELAATVRSALEEMSESFAPNLSEALQAGRDVKAQLSAAFDRAEQLAQALGG